MATVMSYHVKLSLYISIWVIVAIAIDYYLLRDPNFFTVLGIALLMGLAILVIGRRVFGQKGCFAEGMAQWLLMREP
jgi:hypothetical protein